MSQQKHTPEPWSYRQDDDHPGCIVENADGHIGENLSETDARRIVACVNACRGIHTKTLEACSSSKDPGITTSYEKIISQRDELLAALKGIFSLHEPEGRFQPSHFKPFLRAAREAIAKCETLK